ncbi:MAG: site-specific DNA-methyltransferase [Desulfobacteraceae bacterium IS3]|nr:MAG: site-specific DNA-methyltransferase [Desulfobacteraceae bacterium IS3]HAO19262.1 site-specific DNA-methyltransferase [Desulfobacteraceae bacterium]
MPNKSHHNAGLIAMNTMKKNGISHSAAIEKNVIEKTFHAIYIEDAVTFLKKIPDNSIQLILIDPPYNLDIAMWDTFSNYLDWAKQWLNEVERILTDTGNCVIFGGFQFQNLKNGDLLEILHYLRHNTELMLINLIVWYYKNGMSAYRYFANRHEEAIWLAKTKKYYFNLDDVRIPFDEQTKELYKKDKRLRPESIEKGKNPTNVWEIGRLNGNSIERVGHPTQKPLEIIRRFVKALSYPNSLVLDFFAGSGTTGRICIEENRNSIMVDNDIKLIEYFNTHKAKMQSDMFRNDYEIKENPDLNDFFEIVTNYQN